MASSPELAIERLQAAVVDGRTENVRYRQDQLQSLHKALREGANAICGALAQDAPGAAAEVEAEYYLAMDAVRHFYEALDFDAALRDEYLVARGRDNAQRRVGHGMVVIRPTSHTRFYSVVCPLAAAISAGNCVVVELQDTLLQVDSALRDILPAALDPNTFCLSSQTVTDASVLDAAVLVDQTTTTTNQRGRSSLTTQLLSASTARCVAIVDRSADVAAAARALAAARFSFGGASPYAPDLVLVNEYVKKDFFEACSRHASLAFAGGGGNVAARSNLSDETRRAVKEAEDRRQVSSFGSSDFKLVDIQDKNTPLMNMKISGRYLPITTCSGLVDAVFNQQSELPLLAGYFFGDAAATKYMAQHLPCHVACVNRVPAQLLVGPAAPTAHDPAFEYRYSAAMFSALRPQYVEPPPASAAFARAAHLLLIEGGGEEKKGAGAVGNKTTTAARALATAPLRPTGQPSNWGIGFFEQGILLGLGVALSVILPVAGYTTWLVGRKGWQLAARIRQ
ncbi:Aldehyde/histidinol dehydrogenase [Xylariaceae sp. FL0804]|nr:Aldehyde/histidinol dehydrogenase [Xylariaceae sp. FL0804]